MPPPTDESPVSSAWKRGIGPKVSIDPSLTILSLFQAQAAKSPTRLAVQEGTTRLNYRDLDAAAQTLALALKGFDDDFVASLLPQSIAYLIAQIGGLKAGKTFCPLDVNNPKVRLFGMLNDLGRPLLLTTEAVWKATLPDYDRVLLLDSHAIQMKAGTHQALQNGHSENGVDKIDGNPRAAMILFTSGSTGAPKGTYLENHSLVNFIQWFREEYAITPTDKSLFYSNPSFDMAITQCWPFLVSGGSVVIVPPGLRRNLPALLPWVKAEGLTFLKLPSVVAEYFLDKTELQSLRYLVFAGERLSFLHDYKMSPKLPFRVGHSYGLTEGTLGQTNVTYGPCSTMSLSVGRPINNLIVQVLDENLQPVGQGEVGEIYLGGAGLSPRGYHNRPVENAKACIPIPALHGTVLFRTGDLGVWRGDESLEVLGRKDDQVKMGGCRVELGEIETALSKHSLVKAAVVVCDKGPPKVLKAFVMTETGTGLSIGDMATFLRGIVPEYGIPSSLTILSSFPLTPNGKVDRKGLEGLEVDGKDRKPVTELEISLAKIWSDLLQFPLTSIRIDQTFQQLGGNSLKASELLHRVKAEWEAEVSYTQFLEHPALGQFAKLIGNLKVAGSKGQELDAVELNVQVENTLAQITFTDVECGPREGWTLLSGATGYLGSHLLAQLLVQSNDHIYCLVRSGTDDKGKARILAKLKVNHLLPNPKAIDRIHGVSSDLALPKFGLTEHKYLELAEKVSRIVHCGADVHHFMPYADLEGPNVQGTKSIIQLAHDGRRKFLHHISTAAACEEYGKAWHEVPLTGIGPICRSGYSQTKWVAEKVVTEGMTRGLSAAVYRVGDLGAHSEHAVFNPSDLFSSVIKTFLESISFVDGVEWPLFAEADKGARAMVELMLQTPAPQGKIFHVGTRVREAMSAELKKVGLVPFQLGKWLEFLEKEGDRQQHAFITREWFFNRTRDFQGDTQGLVDYLNFEWTTENVQKDLSPETRDSLILRPNDIRRYVQMIHKSLCQGP